MNPQHGGIKMAEATSALRDERCVTAIITDLDTDIESLRMGLAHLTEIATKLHGPVPTPIDAANKMVGQSVEPPGILDRLAARRAEIAGLSYEIGQIASRIGHAL